MHTAFVFAIAVAALSLAGAFTPVWAQPNAQQPAPIITLTDDVGQTATFKSPPKRVVSVLPSLTETVCMLGACDRLVGVDRYSNWPEAVQKLPKVGGGIDPNIEAIVALRPDVVLASASVRGLDRLKSLGIPLVIIEPKGGMDDVRRMLLVVAKLLGLPAAQADAVWQNAQQQVHAAVASMPKAGLGKRVFFEASAGPYGAGPQSFIGDVLTALSLVNVLPATLGPFPLLNPEYVLQAQPQLIMSSERADLPNTSDPQRIQFRYPGWSKMPAVKDGRVCLFTRAQADVLVRPGPRIGEAAQIVADCVRSRAHLLEAGQ